MCSKWFSLIQNCWFGPWAHTSYITEVYEWLWTSYCDCKLVFLVIPFHVHWIAQVCETPFFYYHWVSSHYGLWHETLFVVVLLELSFCRHIAISFNEVRNALVWFFCSLVYLWPLNIHFTLLAHDCGGRNVFSTVQLRQCAYVPHMCHRMCETKYTKNHHTCYELS